MSANVNRANVTVDLVDVYKEGIHDDVRLAFDNTDVRSFSDTYAVTLRGQPEVITGVPAFPTGHANVTIMPALYRYKKTLIHVTGIDQNLIAKEHFVDAAKANPRMIDYQDLPSKTFADDLRRLLDESKIDGPRWDGLDPHNRATILNLCAKMLRERVSDQPVIAQIISIDQTRLNSKYQERIYALVKDGFLDALRALPKNFKNADGSMHDFPNGWKPVPGKSSFKTRDDAGNIQFTFAQDAAGKYYCDIDLDDHSGVKHAFDVIGHKLSGHDTDPYNIHEILQHFQGLDPEYRLL
jgi:hypothetical protein